MTRHLLTLIGCLFFALCITACGSEEPPTPSPDTVKRELQTDDTAFQQPSMPTTFPALLVRNQGDTGSVPMRMSALDIDVTVIGNIATTRMEMRFFNGMNRILEGQLYFPLGEGQSVSGFAMDVNGELREGVIVEKAKGRQVFESTVRQQIDPGLLEWTKGNNFKARIYPIPANGHKTVVISYEQELIPGKAGNLYQLPLLFEDAVDQFDLRVEVVKQDIVPDLEQNELANFSFEQWRDSYVAEAKHEQYIPNQSLAFSLPLVKTEQVYTEAGTAKDEDDFFYVQVKPETYLREKAMPKQLTLLWDVSNSSNGKDVEKELDILDAYFQKISSCDVELISFSNAINDRQRYHVVGGDWSALKAAVVAAKFDGGTQYGALDLSTFQTDEFLLCSDGLSSFGDPDMKMGKAPVMVLNSNVTSDHSVLKHIANKSGGEYLNLAKLTKDQAIKKLSNQTYRFISATYPKNKIADTYPSEPTTFTRNFTLAGKLKADASKMTLNFGFGTEVVDQIQVDISKGEHETSTGLVRRIWAQKKLAELDILPDLNSDKITALGKKFGLVTRNTSLIVLDRIEDYVQHEIEPPTSMREEYLALLKDRKENEEEALESHIQMVLSLFNARVAWYDEKRNFDVKLLKEKFAKQAQMTGNSGVMDSTVNFNEVDELTTESYSQESAFAASVEDVQEEVEEGVYEDATEATPPPSIEGEVFNSSSNLTTGDHVTSFGQTDGSFNATGTGGAAPYTSQWNFGDGQGNDAGGENGSAAAPSTSNNQTVSGEIEMATQDLNGPYMGALRKAKDDELYQTYLELKQEYGKTPTFFLDASDYFAERKMPELALRILSNIAEMELENHELMRVLAHRLEQLRLHDLAILSYEEVLKLREEEPQSYRDLGLCLAEAGRDQEAIDLLAEVVNKSWDGRFPEIQVLVLGELNAIAEKSAVSVDMTNVDARLRRNLDCDVRVVLNWDGDNCDMDLWVTDPVGEKCFYSNRNTQIGGFMSHDFTGGYGPEEFLIKDAIKGKYTVQVNYYGTTQQRISGPVTLQAKLITNYGKKSQQEKAVTLKLASSKEVIDVGTLVFDY
jgi:tetratricopeptide (TPR) repeat protein